MPGLIRSSAAVMPRALSLGDLDRQGREIVQAARRQAASILATARDEAERLAGAAGEKARQQGLAEGRAAGEAAVRSESIQKSLVEARERIDALTGALRSALQRFEREKLSLLAAGEARLVELALAAARRVCKIEVGRGGEVALANARALVERMKHEGDLEIALCPVDHETLSSAVPTLGSFLEQFKHVRLVVDRSLSPGDCVARSSAGEIDAGIELQLDRLTESILGVAEPTGPEANLVPGSEAGHE